MRETYKRRGCKGIAITGRLKVFVDEDIAYNADEQSAQNLVDELRTALHLYGHPIVQLGLKYDFAPEKEDYPSRQVYPICRTNTVVDYTSCRKKTILTSMVTASSSIAPRLRKLPLCTFRL